MAASSRTRNARDRSCTNSCAGCQAVRIDLLRSLPVAPLQRTGSWGLPGGILVGVIAIVSSSHTSRCPAL
jgi:hypothetical protein